MERLTATTPVDPASFREVLGTFASGITVVAGGGGGRPPAGRGEPGLAAP
ncbi:hypothetical protein ACFXD5_13875 [Streptomyces sp. NPDC059385]